MDACVQYIRSARFRFIIKIVVLKTHAIRSSVASPHEQTMRESIFMVWSGASSEGYMAFIWNQL